MILCSCNINEGISYQVLFVPGHILLAARSTKGIGRLSYSERATLALPGEVKEILVGVLLGDAHIARKSSTANYRVVYAQTAVAHKEYFGYALSFFTFLR